MFDSLGIATPIHGTVAQIQEKLAATFYDERVLAEFDPQLVIYPDEFAHGGDGKQLVPLSNAPADVYASLFIPTAGTGSVGFRQVRFGHLEYWLRGRSADWRSNIDSERALLKRTANLPWDTRIPRILWAIDFVPSSSGLLAVDFNTAPTFQTIAAVCPGDAPEWLRILEQCAAEYPAWLKQFP